MMMRVKPVTLAFVGALLVSGIARAESWSADASRVTPAPQLSGNSGSGTNWYPANKSYFIWRIQWAEKSDEPCYFKTYSARLTQVQMSVKNGVSYPSNYVYDFKTDQFDTCAGGPNEGSMKDLWYQPPGITWDKLGAPSFITELRVCNSDHRSSDREKVKGIAINGRPITAEGVFWALLGERSEERPNCRQPWRSWSKCPSNQAAVGLELTNPGSVRGIRLLCAPLVTGP